MRPFELRQIYATKQAIIYNYIQNKELYVLTLSYHDGILRIQSYDSGLNSKIMNTYDSVYSQLSCDIHSIFNMDFNDDTRSIHIDLYEDWRQVPKKHYHYIGSAVKRIDTTQFLRMLSTWHRIGLYVSYEHFNLAFGMEYDCYRNHLMTNALLVYDNPDSEVHLTDSEQLNLMSLLLENVDPDRWPKLVPQSQYLRSLMAVMVAEYNYANGIGDDYQLIASHFDLKSISWGNFLILLSKYLNLPVDYRPDNFLQQLNSDLRQRITQLAVIKSEILLAVLDVLESQNIIELVRIYRDLLKIE